MKIVTDESSMNLGALLGTLRSVAPDVWESRDLSVILPQQMGDLEKPEFLNRMKDKIQKLHELKEMMERGSISKQEYNSMKIDVLLR
jgi:hypothetical protein